MLLDIDDNSNLEWNRYYCLQITIKLSEDHNIVIPIEYNPAHHYKKEDWEAMTSVQKKGRLDTAGEHIIFNDFITMNWYEY